MSTADFYPIYPHSFTGLLINQDRFVVQDKLEAQICTDYCDEHTVYYQFKSKVRDAFLRWRNGKPCFESIPVPYRIDREQFSTDAHLITRFRIADPDVVFEVTIPGRANSEKSAAKVPRAKQSSEISFPSLHEYKTQESSATSNQLELNAAISQLEQTKPNDMSSASINQSLTKSTSLSSSTSSFRGEDELHESIFGQSSGTGLVLNCSFPLPDDIVMRYAYLTCDDVTILEQLIYGNVDATAVAHYLRQLFQMARRDTFRRLAVEAHHAGCQNVRSISNKLRRQITRKLQNEYSDWIESEDFSFVEPMIPGNEEIKDVCIDLYKVFVACALTDPPLTLGDDADLVKNTSTLARSQFVDEAPTQNDGRHAALVFPSLYRKDALLRDAQYYLLA